MAQERELLLLTVNIIIRNQNEINDARKERQRQQAQDTIQEAKDAIRGIDAIQEAKGAIRGNVERAAENGGAPIFPPFEFLDPNTSPDHFARSCICGSSSTY